MHFCVDGHPCVFLDFGLRFLFTYFFIMSLYSSFKHSPFISSSISFVYCSIFSCFYYIFQSLFPFQSQFSLTVHQSVILLRTEITGSSGSRPERAVKMRLSKWIFKLYWFTECRIAAFSEGSFSLKE